VLKPIGKLFVFGALIVRSSSPFVEPPREKNVTWLEARLVAQIAFQEWTADQKLRQPVFLGLRDDKEPRAVVLPPEV
jgi:bifunctional non-homologous end joining protein LigD